MSPSLSFLKGVAKLKNLQDEVPYVLVCVAEAWWYSRCKRELRVLNNEVWLEGSLSKTTKMLIKLPEKLLS